MNEPDDPPRCCDRCGRSLKSFSRSGYVCPAGYGCSRPAGYVTHDDITPNQTTTETE